MFLASLIAVGVAIFNKNLPRNTRILLGVIGGLELISGLFVALALAFG